MTDGNGVKCKLSFFRVFDLADFFDEQPIRFLKNRTSKEMQEIFLYSNGNCSLKALLAGKSQSNGSESESNSLFIYCDESKGVNEAYMSGLIRSNFRERFFYPIYRFNNKLGSLCALLRGSADDGYNKISGIYKENWLSDCENNSNLKSLTESGEIKLSISPHGIAYVWLSGEIEISVQPKDDGAEFKEIKENISKFLKPQSDQFEKNLSGVSSASDLGNSNSLSLDIYPNLISFISLAVIWRFLKCIYDKCNGDKYYHPYSSDINAWFNKAGNLLKFQAIWEKCTSNRLPLRHELAFFYFEHNNYKWIFSNRGSAADAIDKLYQLGFFISSEDIGDEIFLSDLTEQFKQGELCITNNGTAHFVGGVSLIVAVTGYEFRLQGYQIKDEDYWKWMFRLICCLRECFILSDICSRNLTELRENYDRIRGEYLHDGISLKWWNFSERTRFHNGYARIQDDLALISNLLFTVEGGINSVLASRMPFVQEKLKFFVETMGLLDLIENVTKRRDSLESRMQDETTRIYGAYAFNVACIALLIAVLAFVNDLSLWSQFKCIFQKLISD